MKHQDQTNEAVNLLTQLIATPSLSRTESVAADIVESYLRSRGCDIHRKANNVWVLSDGFDDNKPTILLDAHIDTVKPAGGWTHDPFTPELTADGRLYGLGSNDDGGSLVSLMQVFLMLDNKYASSAIASNTATTAKTSNPSKESDAETAVSTPCTRSYNLIFLASAEEEVSGKNGIECVLPELPKIDFCIAGEPTCMQPATAEKGLMVIDAIAHGKAGHAARNEGINAIYIALDDIRWVQEHQYERQTELLGPVKQTVTIINAGTQHNVVPDECRFTIDVRSNECYSNQEILDEIAKNLKSEVHARSTRLNSSRLSADHPFVVKAKSLGLQPFGSPTLSNQALIPFPSVKIGPGDSARSHTADEYIKVSEIDEAIDLYLQLLDINL